MNDLLQKTLFHFNTGQLNCVVNKNFISLLFMVVMDKLLQIILNFEAFCFFRRLLLFKVKFLLLL